MSGADEAEVRAAISRYLDSRRSDPDFMRRLNERMEEDAGLLARLVYDPPALTCDRCGGVPTHLTRSGFRLCTADAAAVPDAAPFDFPTQPGGQET